MSGAHRSPKTPRKKRSFSSLIPTTRHPAPRPPLATMSVAASPVPHVASPAFRSLRLLLPFGPKQSPAQPSPSSVSPASASRSSFAGFGSMRRSITRDRERERKASRSIEIDAISPVINIVDDPPVCRSVSLSNREASSDLSLPAHQMYLRTPSPGPPLSAELSTIIEADNSGVSKNSNAHPSKTENGPYPDNLDLSTTDVAAQVIQAMSGSSHADDWRNTDIAIIVDDDLDVDKSFAPEGHNMGENDMSFAFDNNSSFAVNRLNAGLNSSSPSPDLSAILTFKGFATLHSASASPCLSRTHDDVGPRMLSPNTLHHSLSAKTVSVGNSSLKAVQSPSTKLRPSLLPRVLISPASSPTASRFSGLPAKSKISSTPEAVNCLSRETPQVESGATSRTIIVHGEDSLLCDTPVTVDNFTVSARIVASNNMSPAPISLPTPPPTTSTSTSEMVAKSKSLSSDARTSTNLPVTASLHPRPSPASLSVVGVASPLQRGPPSPSCLGLDSQDTSSPKQQADTESTHRHRRSFDSMTRKSAGSCPDSTNDRDDLRDVRSQIWNSHNPSGDNVSQHAQEDSIRLPQPIDVSKKRPLLDNTRPRPSVETSRRPALDTTHPDPAKSHLTPDSALAYPTPDSARGYLTPEGLQLYAWHNSTSPRFSSTDRLSSSPSPSPITDHSHRVRKRSMSVQEGRGERSSAQERVSNKMGASVGPRVRGGDTVGERLGRLPGVGSRPGSSLSVARPVSSMSTNVARGTKEHEGGVPRLEWLGPRTAKAFRAAGLLDFDRERDEDQRWRSGDDLMRRRSASLVASQSDVDSECPPVSAVNAPLGLNTSALSRFVSLRSASDFTPRTLARSMQSDADGFLGRRGSGGAPFGTAGSGYSGSVAGSGLMESPTFSLSTSTSRDRDTPRSVSTAPTSVSGSSFGYMGRERERGREKDREREEAKEMKEKHATEMGALLAALSDSQRTVRVLREENGELRVRLESVSGLEEDNRVLKEEFEELKRQYRDVCRAYGEMQREETGVRSSAKWTSFATCHSTHPSPRDTSPFEEVDGDDQTPGLKDTNANLATHLESLTSTPITLQRRFSNTSSIFPLPPSNMTLLLHENVANTSHGPAQFPPSASDMYCGMSPALSSSMNISPMTANFSMATGSPGSLFLKPEHEMLLEDMESFDLGVKDRDFDLISGAKDDWM